MRRVWSADPELAELADVARFWKRVRLAVEVFPIAELQVALDVAWGLRDRYRLFPHLDHDMTEVAAKIEQRAWERERRRLGIGK